MQFRSLPVKKISYRCDFVSRIILHKDHPAGFPLCSAGCHNQLFSYGPEAHQTDAEFPLNPFFSRSFQFPFYGISDVGRHIDKIVNTVAVIDDFQISCSVFFSPDNGDFLGMGINGILYEFRNCFQRIILGKSNNRYGIPVVTDF